MATDAPVWVIMKATIVKVSLYSNELITLIDLLTWMFDLSVSVYSTQTCSIFVKGYRVHSFRSNVWTCFGRSFRNPEKLLRCWDANHLTKNTENPRRSSNGKEFTKKVSKIGNTLQGCLPSVKCTETSQRSSENQTGFFLSEDFSPFLGY